MNQRVPSWDLEDVHPNDDIYKLVYEVAELTWENGQVALHELASRRVPTKSHPTASWENPRAAETLEALVNQATLQPYHKTDISVNDGELVPWVNPHNPTVNIGNLNQSAAMTSDAMVPNSNNRIGEGSAQGQPSVKSVGSCSGRPSAFMVARGGGGGGGGEDMGALVTADVYGGDLGGRRVMSTSMGSPENTSSGRDCSNSTFHDHTASHRGNQRETKVNEKKKEKAKSSITTKRRRTAAIHNQSERKRRDKINQKLKTLQKLVPNSSKTDKASMLDEVIEHIKQLQLRLNTTNMMNMSPMMISLMMQHQYQQQQLELHKSLMNHMGMGMGGMDMNTIGPSNINLARFHPSAFMPMPSWNNHITDQVANTNTMVGGPTSTFLAPQSQFIHSLQLPNMDSYSRMAALYQQMQHQPCGPFPKN